MAQGLIANDWHNQQCDDPAKQDDDTAGQSENAIEHPVNLGVKAFKLAVHTFISNERIDWGLKENNNHLDQGLKRTNVDIDRMFFITIISIGGWDYNRDSRLRRNPRAYSPRSRRNLASSSRARASA